jgi:hypothetical protein
MGVSALALGAAAAVEADAEGRPTPAPPGSLQATERDARVEAITTFIAVER